MTEEEALASIKAQFARDQAAESARQASDGLWRSQMNLNKAIQSGDPEEIARQQGNVSRFQQQYDASKSTVSDADKTTAAIESNNTITNPSKSDVATAEKYADPNSTPSKTQAEMLAEQTAGFDTAEDIVKKQNAEFDDNSSSRRGIVPPGAQRNKAEAATAKWAGVNDLRVILKVHKDYLVGKSASLASTGGVLFPYTPQISYDTQATYGNANPLHSNYTQYFYKNSTVSPIQITGKFTVQNEQDGIIWLATQHLLRSLVKMKFGPDADAGAPPPVCRLNGFGDYQLANVPVVVQSFKFDLPDSIDYIRVSKVFGNSLVPTLSTLSLTLIPIYSRNEIQQYGVGKFINGEFTGRGYL